MKSVFYERLFLMNRCLEQVSEILEQLRQEELIHPVFAADRQRIVEDLRADLSHVVTGLLHQRELEACVAAVVHIQKEKKTQSTGDNLSQP
jgi:hypothetical protein